ncbi:10871_t:CDS:2, partial [Scutellospora calospora]
PDFYGFSFLDICENQKEYIFLTFKNEKLKKVPDEFRCEFNRIPIRKTKYEGIECFEISDIGEYIFFLDDEIYRKLITHLSIPVYTFLLNEAKSRFKENFDLRGNDMELFNLLTGTIYKFNDASIIFNKNFEEIKNLIINFKYIPFPFGKSNDTKPYPSIDGFEDINQMNIITRAILINPILIKFWKETGYHDICKDTNTLVIQAAMIILFSNQNHSIKPDKTCIIKRFKELENLGFILNNNIVLEIFILFENRLEEIGDVLMKSFIDIFHVEKILFLSNILIVSSKFKNHTIFTFISRYF